MSKPDSTRTAESSAPASEQSAEWGAALSQRSRGSETKIALLLVVVLLGALSFVVYKKMNLNAQDVAQSTDFQPVSDSAQSESVVSDESGTEDVAPWQDEPGAAAGDGQTDPWSDADGDQTSPAFAQSEPVSVEWGSAEADGPNTTTQARLEMSQSEPETAGSSGRSDEAWDPFASQDTPVSEGISTGSVAADKGASSEAFDPFAGSGGQSEPPNNGNWSSDSSSGSADPFTGGDSDTEEGSGAEATVAASGADGPVMELFADEASVTQNEPVPASESAGESPWDLTETTQDESIATVETRQPTEAEPLLMAPSAAQAVPVNAGNPFDAASEPGSEPAPVESASSGFDEESPTVTYEPLPASSEPAAGSWSSETVDFASTSNDAFDAGPSYENDPFSSASGVSLAASEDEVTIHIVKSGESFWTIARQHYGAGRYFNALAAYNQARIPNPQTIRPGMKVMVPDASVLQQRYPQLTGGTYSPGQTDEPAPSGLFVERGQPMYRVGKGDTLSEIAHKHLGRASRWIQIYGMNQGQLTNGGSLKVGMVLRLPSDASQTVAVPGEQ
jgi:nucleoid-associated protein YgaU